MKVGHVPQITLAFGHTEKIINMILWLHSNEFMFVLFCWLRRQQCSVTGETVSEGVGVMSYPGVRLVRSWSWFNEERGSPTVNTTKSLCALGVDIHRDARITSVLFLQNSVSTCRTVQSLAVFCTIYKSYCRRQSEENPWLSISDRDT